jgi:hypothetical protein
VPAAPAKSCTRPEAVENHRTVRALERQPYIGKKDSEGGVCSWIGWNSGERKCSRKRVITFPGLVRRTQIRAGVTCRAAAYCSPLVVAPSCAGVEADIEPAPSECWRRNDRSERPSGSHIRCHHRTGKSCESNRYKQSLLEHVPPPHPKPSAALAERSFQYCGACASLGQNNEVLSCLAAFFEFDAGFGGARCSSGLKA